MAGMPLRADSSTVAWFYSQHYALWSWIAELTARDVRRVLKANPSNAPDYALKQAWPGWGDRWGRESASFACEMAGHTRDRCLRCPLGKDYCLNPEGGYRKFIAGLESGDIELLREGAAEVRDAWEKPKRDKTKHGWW